MSTGRRFRFAWGACLAYAATGRPPFRGERVEAIGVQILAAEPDLSGRPDSLVGVDDTLVLTSRMPFQGGQDDVPAESGGDTHTWGCGSLDLALG